MLLLLRTKDQVPNLHPLILFCSRCTMYCRLKNTSAMSALTVSLRAVIQSQFGSARIIPRTHQTSHLFHSYHRNRFRFWLMERLYLEFQDPNSSLLVDVWFLHRSNHGRDHQAQGPPLKLLLQRFYHVFIVCVSKQLCSRSPLPLEVASHTQLQFSCNSSILGRPRGS